MRQMVLRGEKIIGDNYPPYIIAELNSSHNGKVDVAKEMIVAAKDCGCDCVKFQSWSANSLYCDEYYINNPISKRIVTKFSLNQEQLAELSSFCLEVGIDFSSTPYSKEEVDFLSYDTKAPFIKIASMEINNLPYIKYIAEKDLPIILSTGMSTLNEIKEAVKTIESTGNTKLCILHCVSVYPAPVNEINLNNIQMLQEEFPNYVIGYSDHTMGVEVAAASVAKGASVIEKHFTLDNKKMGMDNNMATEPEEMKKMVDVCHNVYDALGYKERRLLDGEEEQRIKMRRSLVTTRDIHCGEIIAANDIDAKRPGDGLSPQMIDMVIGKKAKIDIPKGYLIRKEYID